MTDIPDAAIEAAAEALWGDFAQGEGEYPNFSDYAKKEQDYWRHDARAAIEAAMPAIREAIAQEIEAGTSDANWSVTFRNGMSHAGRIVRGAQ